MKKREQAYSYMSATPQLKSRKKSFFCRDKNSLKGGQSFYFFDFDDNVARLCTPIFIFEENTQRELSLTSEEYAKIHQDLGRRGIYKNYKICLDPEKGSFRKFRDRDSNWLHRILQRPQVFVQDINEALSLPTDRWKGPAWSCFYYAVLNQRPIALITARGHHPETIKRGIRRMVKKNFLPREPNYLGVFPVNYPQFRDSLDNGGELSVAELKKNAIYRAFYQAIATYGESPYHRFGMSDDDPANIQTIIEVMGKLKSEHPAISFFVIKTTNGVAIKSEVFVGHTEDQLASKSLKQDLL